MTNSELDKIIGENKGFKFSIDRISFKDARNAYYARHRV
jgi:hypothetical protein